MLPNLIIIGASKSGTSALHYYLDLHPQISMSKVKELNFFVEEKNWGQGVDWYKSHFDAGSEIRGEASPGYTSHPRYCGVPERMHSVIPDAKLIYIVRDPIDRIVSQYVMRFGSGVTKTSFSEMASVLAGNTIIEQSCYFMQIERYLQYYPRSQILFLRHEHLLNDRTRTLERVFGFLGVESSFEDWRFTRRINKGTMHRQRTPKGRFLDRLPLRAWTKSLPSGIRYWLLAAYNYPFSKRIEKPEIDNALRQRLEEFLKDDLNRFNALVGSNIDP